MSALTEATGLGDRELQAIAALVYRQSGITLHDGKRELVAARLQKRLRQLGFGSYREYLHLLETDSSGEELVALLDAIATNHTSFFREPQHFSLLVERVVPDVLAKNGNGRLDIWSAACSTGEEPYTIAIALLQHGVHGFRILASDLSTKALARARAGVYRLDGGERLPSPILRAYFERGLGAQAGLARVSRDVRSHVEFARLNLLDEGPGTRVFDIVFCRNVMIYFDRDVRQRVVSMLERRLAPGGFLFVSHSESLNGIVHGLEWIAPAVYRRTGP